MEVDLLGILRDRARLRALADSELMDSPQEERFDRYTELATQILNAPVALVSLVDERRQFFKSASGLPEPWATLRETPLSHSFCKHAVASGEPLIINDACKHPLVRDNAAIEDLGVLAYAGVPLESGGETLGVFCVIDNQPRAWSTAELATVRALAAAVTSEIGLSRSRRELQEKDALIGALTDSALDVIITSDADGRIVFCNRAASSVFGYTRDALLGKPVFELMPEPYRQAHRDDLARMQAGGRPEVVGRVVELRALRANGEEFPIELSISPWGARDGQYFTALLRDVTERERAARTLRETEEQLRLTVEQAPIGIAVVSTEGRWLRVNDALCAMLGYSREQLLALDFQTITHPDDLVIDLDLVKRLLAGELTHFQLEKRYLHRDGRLVWVMLSVSLVRDERGQPDFFISQIEDVTARRHAEAQATTFFQHSVDMLAVITMHGAFERVNPAWRRTLGWPAEALLGRSVLDFVHPEDQRSTIEAVDLAHTPGSEYRVRHRFRAEDGSYRWLEWSTVRTAGDEYFSVARDMTEQMKLEDALRTTSLIDELTGLQNRRGFMLLGEQQLSNANRYRRSMVVLFADLDGMKEINDRLGHEEGDRALKAMAEVLRTTFRRADIIARLGGDEFVVLAEGDRAFAEIVEQRVQTNVERFNATHALPLPLSVSIGITFYAPDQARSLTELLACADKLMYDAKRRRRSQQPTR